MKRILFYLLPILFFAACNKGADKANLTPRMAAVQRIDSLENRIRVSIQKQENPDVSLAMNAIKRYTYFAADFPKDTLSPTYLFRAGQIYEGVLRDFSSAAKLYSKVYKEYPEYKKRPMMLFHEGNAYIEMQDTARAALTLNQFRREYPEHAFADDAQGLLKIMRMDEKQMDAFFKNAEKQETDRAQ